MDFKSNAELIRYYFKELLEDGEEHKLAEIKNYAKTHSDSGHELTNAMFAGTIKTLVESGDGQYEIPRRGVYKKNSAISRVRGSEQTDQSIKYGYADVLDKFRDEIINVLDDAIDRTKAVSYKGSILELSDEEFSILRMIGKEVFDGLSKIKTIISAIQKE